MRLNLDKTSLVLCLFTFGGRGELGRGGGAGEDVEGDSSQARLLVLIRAKQPEEKGRIKARQVLRRLTSCGGTSKETVLRSTFLYSSIQGRMKNSPGPLAPPDTSRPRR